MAGEGGREAAIGLAVITLIIGMTADERWADREMDGLRQFTLSAEGGTRWPSMRNS